MVTKLIRAAALSALLLVCVAAPAQTINVGPSVFCHVTDGAFTNCSPSGLEWSDITPLPGLGASQGALVYTDQRTGATPAIMLMYELSDHHTPMGPNEFFSVQFDAQEGNQLNHYQVTCYGAGASIPVQVLENGLPNPLEGMACSVGFGQSLTDSSFHVLVELEVPMNVLYSPDIPLFWSSAATPCRDPANGGCKGGSNGTPGAASILSGPNTVPETSTLVTASSSGKTSISVVPLNSTPTDFCNSRTGLGILVNHIDAVLPPPPAGNYKNHGDYVSQVTAMTKKAIDSMINFGVLPKNQAQPLQGCVVSIAAKR